MGERGENNPAYQGGKIECSCDTCGKEIKRKPSQIAGSTFCSIECRSKQWKGEQSPLYHDVFDNCSYCEKMIKITKRKVGKRNFCSRDCANLAHSKHISGENNPRYVDGESGNPYPQEFIHLAPSIRERDGHKCALCHRTREDNGKELDVHHIDYDIYHNESLNLVSLCRWCHGKMHGTEEQRYLWKHFWLDVLSQYQPQNTSTTSK
jgi:5-methylcytosine-specific restriction endonuclease McrA